MSDVRGLCETGFVDTEPRLKLHRRSGAYSEASSGTGVNSDTQSNNIANGAGAVYVFTLAN